jgi:hypothetical protein
MYLILNRGLRPTLKAQLDAHGIRIGVGVWVSSKAVDSEDAVCARIDNKTLLGLAPAITRPARERLSSLEMMVLKGKQDRPEANRLIKQKLVDLYPLVTDLNLLEEVRALMGVVGLLEEDVKASHDVPMMRDKIMGVDIKSARDYILTMSKSDRET